MKRWLIVVFLVAGCAHGTANTYKTPYDLAVRMAEISKVSAKCIMPSGHLGLYIADPKTPNAWVDDGKLVFTEGIFSFDDDTLKFVMAHEVAHEKLGHIAKRQAASLSVTGVMLVVNAVVPGAGLLNHAVNPAIVNNYSKTQELEADQMASVAALCMGISKEKQVQIFQSMDTSESGGFWSTHPSWKDRIANIQNPALPTPQPQANRDEKGQQ